MILNKTHGVRHIGVGKVLGNIFSRSITVYPECDLVNLGSAISQALVKNEASNLKTAFNQLIRDRIEKN